MQFRRTRPDHREVAGDPGSARHSTKSRHPAGRTSVGEVVRSRSPGVRCVISSAGQVRARGGRHAQAVRGGRGPVPAGRSERRGDPDSLGQRRCPARGRRRRHRARHGARGRVRRRDGRARGAHAQRHGARRRAGRGRADRAPGVPRPGQRRARAGAQAPGAHERAPARRRGHADPTVRPGQRGCAAPRPGRDAAPGATARRRSCSGRPPIGRAACSART